MMIEYPVGGSLAKDHPFYVQRQADRALDEAIKAGQFCYLFNSRQMGKSSLLVRACQQLEQAGFRCCIVDLTSIGSEAITPQQWYKGVIFELWRGFRLRGKFDIRAWWQAESDLSYLQRLQYFIADVLLAQFSEPLVIFIDEIDAILSLPFKVDDFFGLIRFCYNQRASNSLYNRVSFVLAGVATPNDLIQDKSRTPFNIGQAIELSGFNYQAAMPLAAGLNGIVSHPELILKEIIDWTGGQPFLTQKLCQILVNTARQAAAPLSISPGAESFLISRIVHERILHHWESQDEPEHLRTIRDRLEYNSRSRGQLLGLYRQVLQANLPISSHDSREQIELLLAGLVIQQEGFLRVKNRIYQQVFDLSWVESQLANLRPYAQALDAWFDSDQVDSSRLLRGQALRDAQDWAADKTLSDRDYQFLTASQASDRQETQQALEATRLKAVEAQLMAEQSRHRQERRAARLQRWLLVAVSLALMIATALGLILRQQYWAAVEREQQAKISEVRALVDASQGLFASNQKLDALVAALRAREQLAMLNQDNQVTLQNQAELALQQAISGADEYNRFSEPPAGRYGLAVSPDGQTVITSGQNNRLNLWTGQRLRVLAGHTGSVLSIAVSSTHRFASGGSDRTIRLWQLDGTFFRSLKGHQGAVLTLAFSPDGTKIASGSDDRTIKLWRLDGTLIRTLSGHTGAVISLCFTPSGEIISGGKDGMIQRWSESGERRAAFQHLGNISQIAVNSAGDRIATASDDQTIKIWTLEGKLIKILSGHAGSVNAVAFSPDGSQIASGSSDRSLKLWSSDGTLLKTFSGHRAPVTEIAFAPSPNQSAQSAVISLAGDNTLRFWHPQNALLTPLVGHRAEVWSLAFDAADRRLASASSDQTVRLWQIAQNDIQPKPSETLLAETAMQAVAFRANGEMATAGADQTITLWTKAVRQQIAFKAHDGDIQALSFSPNGRLLASAGTDSQIKVWTMPPLSSSAALETQPPVPPLLATLIGHQSGVFALDFSPDSRVIASTSSDSTVKLWTPDGRLLSSFRGHQLPVWAVAFNPVHSSLASAGEDKTILLWQPNGKVLNQLSGHETSVRAVAFSPDGSQLASGSQDGMIKLWQQQDGKLITTLKGHSASITSLKFTSNQQLASASEDSTVLLWDLEKMQSIDQVFAYSCDWAKDYLQSQSQANSLCASAGSR